MKHKFECEYCGVLRDNISDIEQHELTHKADDENSFGKRLAKARINKGLSQTKLGLLSGVTQNNIWLYENNKTIPKISTVKLLCEALELTVSELLGY